MSKSVLFTLAAALMLLAGCGGAEPPVLTIPTVAATAVPNLPTVAASPTALATAALPTATLPAPATVVVATATATVPAPTATIIPPTATLIPPTSTPAPTVAPLTPTPVAESPVYRVAFVTANDTLNVRRRPDANSAVVAELPADATNVAVEGAGQSVRDGGVWLPVDTADGSGYVNSRFLTEAVSRETFCADPAVTELLNQFRAAVATQDEALMAELVHPTRGIRLRVNWWNEEITFREDEIERLFDDRNRDAVDWGTSDGSGEPIRGTFSDVMLPFLERDLLPATQWACDEILHGPTAGLVTLPEGYEAVNYYSAYRPAPVEQEFDWGTWVIGVERWEGRYYLSYLIHYRYEI